MKKPHKATDCKVYSVWHLREDGRTRVGAAHYINLKARERSRYVYRIISVDRLLQMFRFSKNVLVQPQLWDDPFENFILNSVMQLPSGEIADYGDRQFVYGQCWTMQPQSDAMWRIYSPKGDGVRIRSTPKLLVQGLSDVQGVQWRRQVYIGKVKYLSEARLKAFARDTMSKLASGQNARSLLVKRLAFSHEREIRLIYREHYSEIRPDEIFSYPVDPHALIDHIMTDPRQSERDATITRERILDETHFKGTVVRSTLYSPPPKLVLPMLGHSRPFREQISELREQFSPPEGWVKLVSTKDESRLLPKALDAVLPLARTRRLGPSRQDSD